MAKALVVYSSRTGETQRIGELIAEGIRISGHEAKVVRDKSIKKESDLDGYDAYVFGSATYHGTMMQGMKTLLFLAETAKLEGKVGAAFGAFGWSGEAPRLVLEVMEHKFEMKILKPPLLAKYTPDKSSLDECRKLGKKVAEMILKP